MSENVSVDYKVYTFSQFGVLMQYMMYILTIMCDFICVYCWVSRYSAVGIATRYGLEGPGIESWWGKIFRTYPDQLRDPSSLLYNGYRVFRGGKGGRGVMLTTHPLLVPSLRKSWAIPPLTLWVLLGLLRGSLYLYIVEWKHIVRIRLAVTVTGVGEVTNVHVILWHFWTPLRWVNCYYEHKILKTVSVV